MLRSFGYVGTPTSAASIPVATKASAVLRAFTGAELLRNPPNRYVFNVRASYFDETEAIVRQMTGAGSPKSRFSIRTITVRPGLAGLNALTRRTCKSPRRRPSSAIPLMLLLHWRPCCRKARGGDHDQRLRILREFIKQAKAKQLVAQFVNVSLSVPARWPRRWDRQRMADDFAGDAPPTANKFPIIAEYQKAMKAAGAADLSYTSLEGYIAAKVLVEALRRGGDASREARSRRWRACVDLAVLPQPSPPTTTTPRKFVEMTVLNKNGEVRYLVPARVQLRRIEGWFCASVERFALLKCPPSLCRWLVSPPRCTSNWGTPHRQDSFSDSP